MAFQDAPIEADAAPAARWKRQNANIHRRARALTASNTYVGFNSFVGRVLA